MSKTITAQLRSVASRLAGKSDKHSISLFKVAQGIDNVENLYNNFDPSQEQQSIPEQGENLPVEPTNEQMGTNPEEQVQPFAAEESDTKIPIESFIRTDQEPAVPSNYDTHSCTVIFSAPKDVEESDMMNYILGISKALDVEVKKFEWEKMEPKQNKVVK